MFQKRTLGQHMHALVCSHVHAHVCTHVCTHIHLQTCLCTYLQTCLSVSMFYGMPAHKSNTSSTLPSKKSDVRTPITPPESNSWSIAPLLPPHPPRRRPHIYPEPCADLKRRELLQPIRVPDSRVIAHVGIIRNRIGPELLLGHRPNGTTSDLEPGR